ncbi:MAG: hypothetical protein OEV49_03990 [candidate division Zixibacteria bacterium]|nr:hypothetical protein [candidate division Zixibacteria bacterium]MDH3937885.1 hypothetical protein [candidate division Zixibacteria bacterium]
MYRNDAIEGLSTSPLVRDSPFDCAQGDIACGIPSGWSSQTLFEIINGNIDSPFDCAQGDNVISIPSGWSSQTLFEIINGNRDSPFDCAQGDIACGIPSGWSTQSSFGAGVHASTALSMRLCS